MTPLAITIRAPGMGVAPGSAVTFPVDVVNLGTVVDRYRCELVGLPSGWWSVSPASLELFPQRDEAAGRATGDAPPTTGRFTVTIHPPRTPEATAGPHAFGAKVTSEHDPLVRLVEEGTVEVEPFGMLEATIRPMIATGRFGAKSGVDLVNRGNRPEIVLVEGSDPTDELAFQFKKPTITLAPGATSRIGFRVSAGRPPLIGSAEAEPYTLRLTTKSGDIPGQVLSGTLRRKALIPAGVPGAIATVLALAMGGLALVAITRPPIGPNVNDASPGVPTTVAPSQAGLGGGGTAPTQAPGTAAPSAPTSAPATSSTTTPPPTGAPTAAVTPPPTAVPTVAPTPVPTPTPNAPPVVGALVTNVTSIVVALTVELDSPCPGNQRVNISASVSDPDGIKSVELYWKRPADAAFSKYPYPMFNHVTYWSTSIGQYFGRVYDVGTVYFYAIATDTKGAATTSPTGFVAVLPCA